MFFDDDKLLEKVVYKDKHYWTGPHRCLIPEDVDTCVYSDGFNYLYRTGGITKMMPSGPSPTEERRLAKYATKQEDGTFIYNPDWNKDQT